MFGNSGCVKHNCSVCGKSTSHALTSIPGGCQAKCNVCNNVSKTFSLDDMAKVMGGTKPIPDVSIPDGLQVYLKYYGEGATESEASEPMVKRHVQLTGTLPEVGKPLFTSPRLDFPAMAVPYGEVVRVVLPNKDKENKEDK